MAFPAFKVGVLALCLVFYWQLLHVGLFKARLALA
jgi:hypothetical protein